LVVFFSEKRVLLEQDQGIRMPNLDLNPGQISAVMAYMKQAGDNNP